jgi:hypothetical protein
MLTGCALENLARRTIVQRLVRTLVVVEFKPFGLGMGSIHVSTPGRRDRLWLLNALDIVLLTLLGAAGEDLGYDRYLKSNTTKRRTHSLFHLGHMLYFASMLAEVRLFADPFGAV